MNHILPKGRYWIDISKEPKELGTFEGFLSAFKDSIHVDSTEEDDAFAWYLFTTAKDLVWPEGIGRPTIAGPNIHSRSDTVQRGDPEKDFIDTLPTAGDIGKAASKAASTFLQTAAVVGGIAIGVAVFLATRRK
jgi:hypothetical protein